MTRTRATFLGAAAGSTLLAAVGSWADLTATGAVAGALLGGMVGLGLWKGWIGTVTLAAVLGAIFSCLIGPGFDDYGGNAAPGFAAFAAGLA